MYAFFPSPFHIHTLPPTHLTPISPLLLYTSFLPAAFSPESEAELTSAVANCLQLSPLGYCPTGAHGPLGEWDVSRVTDMGAMFSGASAFNVDLSEWDVSNVTDMFSMFNNAGSFQSDLSEWDVSKVTRMWMMFNRAESFNADLSKWDVSKVTNMKQMFHGATSFKQTLCGEAWVNSKADKARMFLTSPGSISTTVCGAWY